MSHEDISEVELLSEKFPYGHPNFVSLCLEEMELHSSKNRDYTGGGEADPLGNFKRVSEMLQHWGFNLAPHDVALVYMLKQVDAIGNMLGQGYEGKVEGLKGRLQDISVYAKLIGILYDSR